MIAPEASAEFVANMERVLDVYRRPYDAAHPVVCMDETPRQLIGQTREPIPAEPGQPEREDYEYRRLGVCNVFMACEPLAGRRMTQVTARRTQRDWAHFIADIAAHYPHAERITLVMDNLNTHSPASLYEAFAPEKAKALWDRFEFIYTPKHGSWLNMAEIEINVMVRQCLNRRIADIDTVSREVAAWQAHRDQLKAYIVGCGAALLRSCLLAVCRFQLAGVEALLLRNKVCCGLERSGSRIVFRDLRCGCSSCGVECAWHPGCPAIAKR